jgi:hypothetical protein
MGAGRAIEKVARDGAAGDLSFQLPFLFVQFFCGA